MKKTIGIVVLMLAVSFMAQAQRADINLKGKLVDTSAAGKPIPDATVSLLNSRDSSLVTFTLSNAQGIFEIKGIAAGEYRLIISHQEYVEIVKQVQVPAG